VKKNNRGAYERVTKWCENCHKTRVFIVESTISTCLSCEISYDDDADDLFGPVDEVME
jgi:ribosomal protein L37AE/L43A